MSTIPGTLEEATSSAWLSEVLGADVVAVTVGEIDNRISTNASLHVQMADGSTHDLWVKGYFSEVGRPHSSAGVTEAMFYRELAAVTGVRTLHAVFADADEATEANAIVTKDVLSQGAVFLDTLSNYTVDQAAQSLEQLAVLHAATWLKGGGAWLGSRLETYTERRGVPDIAGNFEGPIGAHVPERVRQAQRLYDAYKVIAADVASGSPWCVIHGDPHIGNVFLDGADRPSFLDWQLVQRGPWYLDVGYHIASVLTVADRRRFEEDLVRHYLDRLRAGGVDVRHDREVWQGLRRGMIHGFFLWGITLKVLPERTSAQLERLGNAVNDHDAFAEVGL